MATIEHELVTEAEAWVGRCKRCGLYCVLYEEVEFVCGRCHGEIQPGNAISAAVDAALTTLFEQRLPTTDVLRVLWLASTPRDDTRDEEGDDE